MTAIAASYKRPILTQQAMREKKLNILHGFFFCISLCPFIDLIKKKERHYKDTIERLLEEDIPFALKTKESKSSQV